MHRVLIVCRGEIAVRAVQACRKLGLEPIPAISQADEGTLVTRLADESVCLGPSKASDSYLNLAAIRDAIRSHRIDMVYPGYGFLSENPSLPLLCKEVATAFVGPSPDVIRQMGEKVRAKELAASAGLNILPSSGRLHSLTHAIDEAHRIGFPVLLKAAAGGGGVGMRILTDDSDIRAAFDSASRQAKAAFGSGDLYLERYIERARHVEVQIIADHHGHTTHLYDRDCSAQRRYQKVIEEAPAVAIPDEVRDRMRSGAELLAKRVGYENAGTVEFVVDVDANDAYFIEMNTRIQVEHPVTEETLGLDLVAEQLRLAAGEALTFSAQSLRPSGHAIELRVNAERPRDFMPTPGRVRHWSPPQFPGVRVDSHVTNGYMIPPFYDSMIAKLVVWGRTRADAVALAGRALAEFQVDGPDNTLPFLKDIVAHPDYIENRISTKWLESLPPEAFPSVYSETGA